MSHAAYHPMAGTTDIGPEIGLVVPSAVEARLKNGLASMIVRSGTVRNMSVGARLFIFATHELQPRYVKAVAEATYTGTISMTKDDFNIYYHELCRFSYPFWTPTQ